MVQQVTTIIHPSATIGPDVQLGELVSVGAHVSLSGPMVVGDRVVISAGAALGGPAELSGVSQGDSTVSEKSKGVVIEADVVIRENVVIHQGTSRPTVVGEGSWILNRSYLAHDVQLGRGCTISAGSSIGGHCTVRDLVTIGMNASVHQRRHIGRGAMIGMGSVVTHDVPPWAKAYGVPLRIHGVNRLGLARAGVVDRSVERLEAAFADGCTDVTGVDESLEDDFAWWASIRDRRSTPFAEAAS